MVWRPLQSEHVLLASGPMLHDCVQACSVLPGQSISPVSIQWSHQLSSYFAGIIYTTGWRPTVSISTKDTWLSSNNVRRAATWAAQIRNQYFRPWPNRVASRCKLKTWIYLRHLHWLAMTCTYFGLDQIQFACKSKQVFHRLATQPKSKDKFCDVH